MPPATGLKFHRYGYFPPSEQWLLKTYTKKHGFPGEYSCRHPGGFLIWQSGFCPVEVRVGLQTSKF